MLQAETNIESGQILTTQPEMLSSDAEAEIIQIAKDAVIGLIGSFDYCDDLKITLAITAQEHFDSNDAMVCGLRVGTREPQSKSISILSLNDKLWGTFLEYRRYRASEDKPLETEVEASFRTGLIPNITRIMCDAGSSAPIRTN